MNRAIPVLVALLLTLSGQIAITIYPAPSGRSDQSNNPPYIKARIPDFNVQMGTINNTTNDLDLLQYFSDPDLPPAGNDSLGFFIINSTFPTVLTGANLLFGPAPTLAAPNRTFGVLIIAMDRDGLQVSQCIVVTVFGGIPPPPFHQEIEIHKDTVAFINLSRLFPGRNDLSGNITYVGGASANLTVEVAANGTAVLTPATGYVCDAEILRFSLPDPIWTNISNELVIRFKEAFDQIYCRWDLVQPDPAGSIAIYENESISINVSAAVSYENFSRLHYIWSLDGTETTGALNPAFCWTPNLDDSGQHLINCRVGDLEDHIDIGWNVTVKNLNRPPVITYMRPLDFSNFTFDARINFQANATDPDGDTLLINWWSDHGLLKTDIGNSSNFTKNLPTGVSYIRLEVEDGQGGYANQSIFVRVYPRQNRESQPTCFSGFLLIVPVSLPVSFAILFTRKNH